jgi:hypothetical protein
MWFLVLFLKFVLHPRTRLLTVQTSDTLTCLTLYHLFLFSSSYLFLGAFGVTDRLIVLCPQRTRYPSLNISGSSPFINLIRIVQGCELASHRNSCRVVILASVCLRCRYTDVVVWLLHNFEVMEWWSLAFFCLEKNDHAESKFWSSFKKFGGVLQWELCLCHLESISFLRPKALAFVNWIRLQTDQISIRSDYSMGNSTWSPKGNHESDYLFLEVKYA